jgi:hypothetical protein
MISNNRLISVSNTKIINAPVSLQTKQILNLGQRNGWGFTVLGKADLPDRPIHLEKWLIIPAHEDHSSVPKRTLERIQAIYTAGLQPKGFVIVHEAPRYLPGKTEKKTDPSGSSTFSSLVAGVGTVLSAMAMMIFPVMLLGLAVLDPIVIAVMDDGNWVEIDRWNVG